MAITLPKYGTVVPSETTRFSALGKELREFGESIEDILESFDYNGADPNLVLARVTALEAWRATATAQIATLEAAQPLDTGWVPLTPATGFTSGNAAVRRVGDFVGFRGSLTKGTAISQSGNGDLAANLPDTRFAPVEYARITASGYAGVAANVLNAYVWPDDTRLNVTSSGATQTTLYLGGIFYFAA